MSQNGQNVAETDRGYKTEKTGNRIKEHDKREEVSRSQRTKKTTDQLTDSDLVFELLMLVCIFKSHQKKM